MRSRLLAWAVVTAFAAPAAAQDKPEPESFETADGVKLQGIFYKAHPGKSKNNACVILIHPFKSPTPGKKLNDLATTLAADGYNVLQFNLRGHGPIPTDVVATEFWKYPHNAEH